MPKKAMEDNGTFVQKKPLDLVKILLKSICRERFSLKIETIFSYHNPVLNRYVFGFFTQDLAASQMNLSNLSP